MTLIEVIVLLAYLSAWRLLTLGIARLTGVSTWLAAVVAFVIPAIVWIAIVRRFSRRAKRPHGRHHARSRAGETITALALVATMAVAVALIVAAARTLP